MTVDKTKLKARAEQLMSEHSGAEFDPIPAIPVAASDVLALLAEIDQLKGIHPGFPPRPPEGEGLPRYGLRWNGPQQPLATPMDDGYWTPWHLADQLKAESDRNAKNAAEWEAASLHWMAERDQLKAEIERLKGGRGEPVAYRYKESRAAWESEKPWEPTTLAHGAVLLERKALSAAGTFKGDSQAYYLALTVEPLYTSPLAPESEALPRYTCVGKGGEYELLGSAIGSGTLKDMSAIPVYRDTTTGQLFVRTPLDFSTRMSCLEKVARDSISDDKKMGDQEGTISHA
jgi:hypothetical protein